LPYEFFLNFSAHCFSNFCHENVIATFAHRHSHRVAGSAQLAFSQTLRRFAYANRSFLIVSLDVNAWVESPPSVQEFRERSPSKDHSVTWTSPKRVGCCKFGWIALVSFLSGHSVHTCRTGVQFTTPEVLFSDSTSDVTRSTFS